MEESSCICNSLSHVLIDALKVFSFDGIYYRQGDTGAEEGKIELNGLLELKRRSSCSS